MTNVRPARLFVLSVSNTNNLAKASIVPCCIADGPVPAEKEQRATKYVPWDLNDDLRRNQRSPAIHATGAFANLVNTTRVNEWNLQLLCDRHTENGSHE